MTTSSKGIALIEKFEGFSATMYKDAVGIPTIGYGTRVDSPGLQSLMTATITQSQAEDLLKQHLVRDEGEINNMVKAAINQNQFEH